MALADMFVTTDLTQRRATKTRLTEDARVWSKMVPVGAAKWMWVDAVVTGPINSRDKRPDLDATPTAHD